MTARAATPGLLPSLGQATLAALFHGVDGGAPPPSDPEVWTHDVDVIVRQRLAGLALLSAKRSRVPLPATIVTRLEHARGVETARCLMIETAAVGALHAMDEAGIPLVVTKGPAVAEAYPHASLRPFFDVDALVPPDRFEAAFRILHRLGFSEPAHQLQPRSYFNRWCREGVNLIRADGGSIDLHHHVPPWIWGRRLSFRSVLDRSRMIRIAGGVVRAAHPIHNLLITALHVISDKGQPGQRLMIWRDLVALARVSEADAVADEARRVRLDWLLAFVLDQLPTEIRPAGLVGALGHPPIPSGDAIRLRRLLPPALGSRHQIAHAVRLPAPQAIAFVAGYTFPSRAFLRARYGDGNSRLQWWRDAVFRLRSARGAAA